MLEPKINRRTLLRTLGLGLGAATLGRLVSACVAAAPGALTRDDDSTKGDDVVPTKPIDQDEHVPGKSEPVTAEAPLKLPQPAWEGRVRQLEEEQARQYARGVFTRADPGVMKGRENSHEPRATVVMDDGVRKLEVVVEHVMGANKPDAGPPVVYDAGPDATADASADAGRADAGGADAGRDAGSDAGMPTSSLPPQVHYITTIYARAIVDGREVVIGLHEFASTDASPPTVRFAIPAGVTEVEAFEWCTLHGLWKSTPIKAATP
jgi:hypothetical protein